MTQHQEAQQRLLLRVPKRRRIFEAVVAFPGTHARRLSRELAIALGVVEHHIRLLERHRLLFAHQQGRRRTLYAVGHVAPEDAQVIHMLRKPHWGLLLHALVEREQGVASLAAEVGLPPAATSYHLRRLRTLGLLDHVRAGRESAYLVRDPVRVRRLLAALRPEAAQAAPDPAFTGVVLRAQVVLAGLRGLAPGKARAAVLLASAQD